MVGLHFKAYKSFGILYAYENSEVLLFYSSNFVLHIDFYKYKDYYGLLKRWEDSKSYPKSETEEAVCRGEAINVKELENILDGQHIKR